MFNFLARLNVAGARILSLILSELLIYYAAIGFLIIVLLCGYPIFYPLTHIFSATLMAGFLAYLFFAAVMMLAGKRKSLVFIYKRLQKAFFFRKFFYKIAIRIKGYVISNADINPGTFIRANIHTALDAFCLQVFIIAADTFTVYSLFKGVGGHVPFHIVMLVLVSTQIVSLVPFLPGSLVLYESGMAFFFAQLGVPLGTGITVTLVYRLLSFWLPIPLGLYFYRRWLKERPRAALPR